MIQPKFKLRDKVKLKNIAEIGHYSLGGTIDYPEPGKEYIISAVEKDENGKYYYNLLGAQDEDEAVWDLEIDFVLCRKSLKGIFEELNGVNEND